MAQVSAGGNGFAITSITISSAIRVQKINIKNNPLGITTLNSQISFREIPSTIQKTDIVLAIEKHLTQTNFVGITPLNNQISFREIPSTIQKTGIVLAIEKHLTQTNFGISNESSISYINTSSFAFWS